MKAEDIAKLVQVGDVVLIRVGKGSDEIGKVIGDAEKLIGDQKTSNAYCHAYLIVGPNPYTSRPMKVEAAAPRVRCIAADLDRQGVEVYRPIKDGKDFPLEVRQQAAENGLSKVGNLYGWLGLIAILITRGRWRLPIDEVCSQLVADAFKKTGWPILEAGKPCETPDDLAASKFLKRIAVLD